MRQILAAAAVAALPLAEAKGLTLKAGPDQPFCHDVLELQEYVQARQQHDRPWLDSLKQDCRALRAGATVVVLGKAPDNDAGPTYRVRLVLRRGSAIGVTTVRGLRP